MTYATQADMDRYFGAAQVLIAADRDGDDSSDASVIREALDHASEEIDSYVGVKYNLPLTASPPPRVLKRVCADIAMFRMSSNSSSMTEAKRERYEDAVKWLKQVAAGKATLGIAETEETADDETVKSNDSETRQFTRTKMRNIL